MDKLKSIQSLLEESYVKIDSFVFRLHYIHTALIMVVFAFFLTSKELVGDPIKCAHAKEMPTEIINTYCWIHATYVIPDAFNKKVGTEAIDPGIDSTTDESKFLYITYYQWVTIMLLLQATMFYIPRLLWMEWEGGRLEKLNMNLKVGLLKESSKAKAVQLLVNYFMRRWKTHNWYAGKYLFCEVMCVLNIIIQSSILNIMLNKNFFSYGTQVLQYLRKKEDFLNPMVRIFPRVTKCRFRRFGSSGNIEVYDALCVMALNNLNDKIYLFLWFWFIFLFILSIFQVIFSTVLFSSFQAREYVLCRLHGFDRGERMQMLCQEAYFGDWFLIYLLSRNMDVIIFRDFLLELTQRIVDAKKPEVENRIKTYCLKRKTPSGVAVTEKL